MQRKYYKKITSVRLNQLSLDRWVSKLKSWDRNYILAAVAGIGLTLGLFISIPLLAQKAQDQPAFQRNLLGPWDYQAQLGYGITTSLAKTKTSARVEVKRNSARINFEVPIGQLSQHLTDAANTIVYASENQLLQVEYSLLPNGIKENIKLFAVPDDYTFVSRLQTNNLVAKQNSSNLPVFFNTETGEYEFHLERPFAEDSAGNRTYQLSYQLRPTQPSDDFLTPVLGQRDFETVTFKHQQFLLSQPETISAVTDQFELVLTVDPDWLYAADRVYPISIDPTVVHDTSGEFAPGQFNRVSDRGSGSAPDLEDYYQENPADPYTILLLHMDEATDNTCTGGEDVCDSSGNGFNGTFNGGAAFVGSGFIGADSITLDGTGDFVSITDTGDIISVTTAYTVEAWINPDSLTGKNTSYGAGIVKSTTAATENIGDFFISVDNDGAFKFANWRNSGTDTDGVIISPDGLISEDTWTHVAAVWDGYLNHLFINGQEVEIVGTLTTGTGWGEQVTIGSLFADAQYQFNGDIDEVRVTHRARTPDEIWRSAQRRNYALFQSDTIDLGATPLVSYDSLSWTVEGDSTEDGETATGSATGNIVAQWNFNETSGTTADNAEGTAALDGTLTGFASTGSQDAAPLTGWTSNNRRWGAGALMFDGSNDYVTVADNAALDITGAITLEVWVKPDSNVTGRRFIDKWSDTTSAYLIGIDNTFDDRFTFGAAGAVVDSISAIDFGRWYHVVGTFDEGTNQMSIYVNGKLDNTVSNAGVIPNSAQELNIGATNDAVPAQFFRGTMDAVKIYDRALTDSEILANYNAARLEMQTRSSTDGSTWNPWTPTGSETAVESFDTASNFTLPDNLQSLNWIKVNNTISSATCDINCEGGGRLGVGSSGFGDDVHNLKGTILLDGGVYKMWYGASDGTSVRIFYATSPDGLEWTKYDNVTPGTCDTTCPGGGIIGLGSNTTGDDVNVGYPTVILDGGTYKMWYAGYDSANWRIYYATSPDGITWTKANNAVPATCDGACAGGGRVGLGTNTTGDDVGVYAPTVILDGSTYKMWYSGNDGTNWRIYYATSSDGLTWTKTDNSVPATCDGACAGGGRVGLGTNTTGDDLHVYYPSVMLDSSTYKMWYVGNDGTNDRVYYATSSDGLTWTKSNNATPAACDSVCAGSGRIGLGNTNRGDDFHVFSPSVILDGSTYKMWYSGYDGTASYRIYNATSSDGLTWIKRDNTIPGACNTDCGGQGRITLGSNGTGDDVYAYAPSIIIDPNDGLYKAWYSGYDGANIRIFYATSSAGTTWTKVNNTAVAACDGACGGDGRLGIGSNTRGDDIHAVYGSVILDGSTYKMWYSGFDGANYRIYYATSSDGLTWTKLSNTTATNCDTTCEGNGKLGLGSNGRGDDVYAFVPTVIKDGSTYRMWYAGYDGATYRIYGATSSDGLTWTKTDNTIPAASNSLTTNGRIALGASTRADDTNVYYPTVFQDESGIFYMMYTADDGSGNISAFLAQSTDGNNWYKVYNFLVGGTSNGTVDPGAGRIPLGSAGRADDAQLFAMGTILQVGNDYKYYYSAFDSPSFRTSMATMNAELNWDIEPSEESVIKTEGSDSLRLETMSAYADNYAQAIWHLDETNGDNAGDDIFDATANNNDGEFFGTDVATSVVDGIKGKAREFNGSDDYIVVDDSLSLDPGKLWTIEAWIKTSQTTDGYILRKHDTDSPFAGYGFRVNLSGNANKISAWMGGSAWVASTSNVNDGQWHYVVATCDSSYIRLYLDGVQEAVSAQACNPRSPSNESLYMGSYNGASIFYDGMLDEVKVSSTVLTRPEIAHNYQLGQNLLINRTITSNDLSGSTKLPFYVAADRPGTYLEAAVSESSTAALEGDSNTLSYWKLDTAVNQWWGYFDYSGNQNYAVHSVGTFTPGIGIRGRAAYLTSATNIYVTRALNEGIGTGPYTVEAWIKPDTFSGYATVYGAGIVRSLTVSTGAIGDFMLAVDDGASIHFFNWRNAGADTDGIAFTADNAVAADKWSYVVAVWDGTNNHIYVNGQEIPIAGTESTVTGWGNFAAIGSNFPGDAPSNFVGSIDEVRISNVARSADEIRQTYEHADRSNQITIDFGAKLDAGNLISGSGDTSFTVDATYYGAQNMGDHLFEGDKIIIKEVVDDTEYLAQGDVTAITISTGATTIDAWDAGSTFPTGGYTANASVFKWQREYWDITKPLDSQIDAVTNLTLSVTDNIAGRTIFVDDLAKAGEYMDNPLGTSIGSAVERYFQYRALYQTFDDSVSTSLTSVTLDYTENEPPNTPSLDSPTDTATNQSLTPVFQTTTTDPNSDNIQYRIELCEDASMTVNCQTFDQSVSQTGWSGQNADTGTTYTSGTQGTYTVQTPLTANTTYYWKSDAIDPSGSNTFGGTQVTPFSFTTTQAPTAPTDLEAEGQTNPTQVTDSTPELTAIYHDPDGDDAVYYRIEVNTASDFTGTVMWDTGQTAMTALADNTRSTAVSYAGTALADATTYYWRIRFWDDLGAEGAVSLVANFTTDFLKVPPLCTLTKNATNTQITVDWTDPNTAETGYQIDKNINSGGFSLLTTTAANVVTYDDNAVSSNNTYQYRIRATDGEFFSQYCTTDILDLAAGSFLFEGIGFEAVQIH